MIELALSPPAALDRYQRPALIVGVVGLAISLIGLFANREQFFRSYLVGFVFIASITLGSLAVLMIQYLTGGIWGIVTRRSLEASTRLLPVLLMAFIPLAFGMRDLFEWARPEVVAHDALLQHKAPYLNITAFFVRAAIYFLLWFLAAYLLNRWAMRQERAISLWRGLKMRHVSAVGLMLMALTLTFASIDWMMSLEPHWFSTMFGISFIVGCGLSALAFSTLMVVLLSRYQPMASVIKAGTFRDLGNLMFAFVMLWAYTAFSEFMLIWYGNIREEVPYFLKRMHGGWGVVAVLLIIFHFFFPFVALLLRDVKERARMLGIVAGAVLFMRLVDFIWLIAPAFQHGEHPHFNLHWLDITAPIGLAGVWFFFFLGQLKRRTMLPSDEPYVQEALSHG